MNLLPNTLTSVMLPIHVFIHLHVYKLYLYGGTHTCTCHSTVCKLVPMLWSVSSELDSVSSEQLHVCSETAGQGGWTVPC